MKSIALALLLFFLSSAAIAGEAVTYTVDGDTFEVYRAEASGQPKALAGEFESCDGLD